MQNVLNSTLQQTSTIAHQALQGDVALGQPLNRNMGGLQAGYLSSASSGVQWGAVRDR